MSEAVVRERARSHSLRAVTGPIPQLLVELAAHCRAGRCDTDALDAGCSGLLQLVVDRQAAQQLLADHGALRWPGAMGQSPYADFTYVLRCTVDGHFLMPGATRSQRYLHARLASVYGPPAAKARLQLGMGDLERRYPRLLRAMRDAAILSHGEAQSALFLLLQAHPSSRRSTCASCEAVAHFGGNLAVVRAAIRRRRLFPSTRLRPRAA